MTDRTQAFIAPGPPGAYSRLRDWWGGHSLAQLGIYFGLGLVIVLLGSNTVATMHRLGINPGFGFLGRSASFEIGETLILYAAGDTYARALLVGLLNTVEVAVVGCALATVLGLLLGISRLSGNLLLSGLVQAYVELIRNTPLLLQLFFWSATLHALPAPRQAFSLLGLGLLSNRGVFVPAVGIKGSGTGAVFGIAALFLLTFLVVWRWRGRRIRFSVIATAGLSTLALALLAAFLAGGRLQVSIPALKGFNIQGGLALSPEFAALLIGLTVNSAATISEIVRSGIESVPRGQWEAARSLGLPGGRVFRLVIMPQAMRVITPLLTSSYLDLTKNSSLAVAIGFPDLVSVVNTSANQTGQAVETIAILVTVYLALNLSVSALMNRHNARVMRRLAVTR